MGTPHAAALGIPDDDLVGEVGAELAVMALGALFGVALGAAGGLAMFIRLQRREEAARWPR